ncbi:enoyl-CoA hydratase [Arthrobacter sp. MYb224]|uniref:enoyl-CoA hydratase/isomerase family protein n=1 Tax=Arthrobacter sp. MYb224 TaxID=1848600 RepID=UPI000CFA94D2|nr:enoyl-CoA hydratase-related protein [Arthrobacter sp. MYb224]PRA00209.1 enoyl-CoA hydratase [Arthrobacter sp. MYb224]
MADAVGEELVLRSDADGVAWLTINRPESLNAMNQHVIARMHGLLDEIELDSAIEVVVFTGAGDKSFVAGADINELAARSPIDALGGRMQNLYDRIAKYPKPTVAAVNGFAFGGGHELALCCDVRIGSTQALFALPETGLGIIPSAGGTQRLARIVGIGRATDMILTGRRLDAFQALQAGLITELVEADELMASAQKLARKIASKGPLAIKLAKLVVSRGFDVDHETGMLLEQLAQALAYSSEEKQEGTRAFLEKRRPDFRSVRQPDAATQNV